MARDIPGAVSRRSVLGSARFQLAVGWIVAALLPALVRFGFDPGSFARDAPAKLSIVGAMIGITIGIYLARRMGSFPGAQSLTYVIPAFLLSFGGVAFAFFVLRLPYSRGLIAACFILSVLTFFWIGVLLLRRQRVHLYMVPGGRVEHVKAISGVDCVPMAEPVVPLDRHSAIVADLHHDLDPAWERMLAVAALSGRPVYHFKQISESLTGRVQIEHLSENSFGSLVPNLAYHKLKRLADVALCLVLLPILALPMALVALAIRLDSPGPIFFRQERTGYGGVLFRVVKFRTMVNGGEVASRDAAITRDNDARITKLGRFLRKSRIDELPQLFNVLRGEMSWIGPRPEAVPLSRWYEAELPFYVYRHIVRPGITGWAQVNQGHVAELADVDVKLQYDFYYIKNFSAWLDLLIALRTVKIILSGFGAR
ncbi:sugar transferase [Sphingomonas gilva]|uniref:Sugar transferase n=1 Tax=Sphingomonas gilva TaxID=2305907 RepID=A0A396RK98_9SPHN|nr:sugar transferase [Sphingomonas gilva]RHW16654.1 sugar transferase [Sphingomonas gilva]